MTPEEDDADLFGEFAPQDVDGATPGEPVADDQP
jgi:hypothetical protein